MFPLTSVPFLVIFCLIFCVVQVLLDQLGTRWEYARKVALPINLAYAVASGLFSLYTLWILIMTILNDGMSFLWSPFPSNLPDSFTPLFYIYYLSKLWEIVDIILVSLMGFPIHLHFRVHHNTTPILGLILFYHRTTCGLIFMIANTFMHFWVYLYHGGIQNRLTFAVVRAMGHVQLLVGIIGCIFSMWVQLSNSSRVALLFTFNRLLVSEFIPLALYTAYFLLFRDEVRQTRTFDELMKSK